MFYSGRHSWYTRNRYVFFDSRLEEKAFKKSLVQNSVVRSGWSRSLSESLSNHILYYPTPTLSYFWSGGSLLGVALVIQLISGIVLAIHYKPVGATAFDSLIHLLREVDHGWLYRSLHANGATLFFSLLYFHIGRALYYGGFRYPRPYVWVSGFAIYVVSMGTAFIGYVLPWGQISFWGATVITNIVSSIPFIGSSLTIWLWGGFSVGDPTLGRFFSLHYFLPFVILALMLIHLFFLHSFGSGKPSGFDTHTPISDPFYPYFFLKDIFIFMCVIVVFVFFVYFEPNFFGHPENFIEANPLVTPAHIVPEWYFLPFYAILRAIPSKFGGVILIITSLLVAWFYPFIANRFKLNPSIYYPRGLHTIPLSDLFYWVIVANFILLGHIGMCPVEEPYVIMGQCSTVFFFVSLFLIPVIYHVEVWYLCNYNKIIKDKNELFDDKINFYSKKQ